MPESKVDTTPPNYLQINQGNNELIQPNISSIISEPNMSHDDSLLGVFYGIGMNVNNVLGSGIVTSPGIIWNLVKSPRIILILWLIGGLISMTGTLTYVELGAMHKISGGETKYLQTAYPKPKLMMSYLFSLMFIFAIQPGIISSVLQTAALYFWYTITGSQYDKDPEEYDNFKFSPMWSIKIIAIATIIGIVKLIINWETSRSNWHEPLKVDTGIIEYSHSILLIMFSYNGWNNLNYSLDEFRNPEKKLIFSNSISVGIVSIMYLLVNIAYISVLPKVDVDNETTNETIAASFFSQLFKSDIVVRIFTLLIALSVIGTAAALVWSGSRVILAAARSNFFPVYSDQLRTWHEDYNTPVNALLVQFIWCSLIILFVGENKTITSRESFKMFAIYSLWFFYLATGVGLVVLRYKRPEEHRPFKVWLPITGLFILAGIFILLYPLIVECSDKRNCINIVRNPIYLSYGFLFIALMSWCLKKKQQADIDTTEFYTSS
ncbi:11323_t:CDS:2 [Funneliformis mosseae]|uniref:11323_t:CDS:1 n=1 Tax=Funneliformis mosseae TaxID=27381 RepID=A0A9N9CMP3_FUNMO|nr:11323_t:CDS:2 [Funneliformis mosseae]